MGLNMGYNNNNNTNIYRGYAMIEMLLSLGSRHKIEKERAFSYITYLREDICKNKVST